MDQLLVPYREGFDYGIGVKRASLNPIASSVKGEVSGVEGGAGGEGTFSLYRLQTTESLEEHLGIDASASGGAGAFSVSARFSFARDCKVQSSSILLLVTATRRLGFRQIDSPVLDDHTAELVTKGQVELFDQRYGDAFVRGMVSGGQFFGVIKIDTRSEESRKKIEAELSGSYGLFKAEVAMNLSTTAKSERSEINVHLYYEGGRVSTRPADPESLMVAIKEWTDSVDGAPKPYAVTLAPYVIARGPQPPNAVALQHQRDILIRCAKLRSRTMDNLNLIEYMLDPQHVPEFVPAAGGPDLGQLQASLSQDLDIIAAAGSHAMENPKEALEPETYAREIRHMADYKMTVLPGNIPKHLGDTVVVPRFADFDNSTQAEQAAANARLKIQWKAEGPDQQKWIVIRQEPPPGTPVSAGSTVTVFEARVKGTYYDPSIAALKINRMRFGINK